MNAAPHGTGRATFLQSGLRQYAFDLSSLNFGIHRNTHATERRALRDVFSRCLRLTTAKAIWKSISRAWVLTLMKLLKAAVRSPGCDVNPIPDNGAHTQTVRPSLWHTKARMHLLAPRYEENPSEAGWGSGKLSALSRY